MTEPDSTGSGDSPAGPVPEPFDREAYRASLAAAITTFLDPAAAQGAADTAAQRGMPALPLTAEQVEGLLAFGTLLAERARLFNLTRLTAPQDMAVLHFLDTVHLSWSLRPKGGKGVLDIGTGAGVPGIPLAIMRPELDVTMIDGTAKKVRFVEECIRTLGLTNARALHARAEEHLRGHQYAAGVLRAAVKPPDMMEILAATRGPLGTVLFMLGRDGPAIAKGLKSKRYVLARLAAYHLPGQEHDRHIAICIRKKSGAPRR